jgi:hypothetical protein
MKKIYYLLIFGLLCFIGCKKDEEDGRGVAILQTYLVSDSVIDPFQTWHFDSYALEISKNSINPNKITIINYLGNGTEVDGLVSGSVITIKQQTANNGLQIQQSNGYYSNDSIFIHMSWLEELGDPYYGDCWGKSN